MRALEHFIKKNIRFLLGDVFWTLELPRRSEIDRRVIKTYYANGTMLRRSAQLLLTPENHQLEGSMHLKAIDEAQHNYRMTVFGTFLPIM